MRILGIDPGTAIVGWSILDKGVANDDLTTIAYGHISTSKDDNDEQRLLDIAQDLEEIITTYKPECLSIEALFFFRNNTTIITVAQARGVIIHTCFSHGLTVHSYTPLQIKQALTGYGKAEKKQMQEAIVQRLSLPEVPKPDDTADALAVALCHIYSYKLKQKLS